MTTADERGPVPVRWVRPVLALGVVGLAAFLLYRVYRDYTLEDLVAATSAVPVSSVLACGVFAALSYLSLTGFDWLALRHVGHHLPYPYVARASFCSLSIGHNIGFAALSSGAIRYRFYSRMGIPLGAIANIIIFSGVTVGLGLLTLGGLCLVMVSLQGQQIIGVPQALLMPIGVLCLLIVAIYASLAAWVRKPLCLFKWRIQLPHLRIALAQIAIGTLNFVFVAACLHQAVSALADVPYVSVASAYVIANGLSLISHIPGGLGVLEGVVLHVLPQDKVIGALMIFRLTYFLIPLGLGIALFAVSELADRSVKHG